MACSTSPMKATAAFRSSASCPLQLSRQERRSPRRRSQPGPSAGSEPEQDGGKVEHREAIHRALFVAGGDSPPLLEVVDEPFYHVALPVCLRSKVGSET